MRRVFADTLYWVALANPNDQWHSAALKVEATLVDALLVTSEEVLTEVLAGLGGMGEHLRSQAVKMVLAIMADEHVLVIPQTHDSFVAGLSLYDKRRDKQYSLVDCVSMNACRAENITDVLTNDNHFRQEGFTLLIPSP